jgi:hypothetical protein
VDTLAEVQFSELPFEREDSALLSYSYSGDVSKYRDPFIHFALRPHFRLRREPNISRRKLRRLVAEVSSLASTLPLHTDSSVFLRVDEKRMDVIQAMITGPLHTPYDGILFLDH